MSGCGQQRDAFLCPERGSAESLRDRLYDAVSLLCIIFVASIAAMVLLLPLVFRRPPRLYWAIS